MGSGGEQEDAACNPLELLGTFLKHHGSPGLAQKLFIQVLWLWRLPMRTDPNRRDVRVETMTDVGGALNPFGPSETDEASGEVMVTVFRPACTKPRSNTGGHHG